MEKIDILIKSVETWNKWREEQKTQQTLIGAPLSRLDLSGANLSEVNLSMANLANTNLSGADLRGVNLIGADLRGATLNGANLTRADLIQAHLMQASLLSANLTQANLSGANLIRADLSGANLYEADLDQANLSEANLSQADLSQANLSDAIVGWTTFTDVHFNFTQGLDRVQHRGPSTISLGTLYLSQYTIPENFLKGAGIPDIFLPYLHTLAGQQDTYHSCLITHSLMDAIFARQLFTDLQKEGIRCWLVSENTLVDAHMSTCVNEAVRVNQSKVLIVLSDQALAADWIKKEIVDALATRPSGLRSVLILIDLDGAALQSEKDWFVSARNTHHIHNFQRWIQRNEYIQAFNLLLRELRDEYDVPLEKE